MLTLSRVVSDGVTVSRSWTWVRSPRDLAASACSAKDSSSRVSTPSWSSPAGLIRSLSASRRVTHHTYAAQVTSDQFRWCRFQSRTQEDLS